MAVAAHRLENDIGAIAILARINKFFLDRLPSRRAAETLVGVSDVGLHYRAVQGAARIVRWQDVKRVVASLSRQFVGNTQVLVFETADGRTSLVNEADPAWRDLTQTLHLHLTGARRAATWQLELVASGSCVQVYQR